MLPRSVPKNKRRVIVHNPVQHAVDTPNGINGFRCWTQLKNNELVLCKCDWAGLPHYRAKRLARLIAADLDERPPDFLLKNMWPRPLGAFRGRVRSGPCSLGDRERPRFYFSSQS